MDPYGSASTKCTWRIDRNPSESFQKVMSRYKSDRLKIIGLQCRPMDMPPVKNVQPILPAAPPMPQRHLTVPPILTNFQPLHVQTTAPNQPPPVPANRIIWANGHSWQNANHNNNFLPLRAMPPQFHGPAPTSTSLRVKMPPTCQLERTHPPTQSHNGPLEA